MKLENLILSTRNMLQKKNGNKEQMYKNQLKKLEEKLDEENLSKYNSVKNEWDEIYDHIVEDTRIRSKCDWYEHGEKSPNFLFEFRKTTRISKYNKKNCCW